MPAGEMHVQPSVATDDPGDIGEVDVVLLGVKAHQVADAAVAIKPMIGPDTFVVPLQNGVESAAVLCGELGRSHVVGGLCGTLSWVTAPGHIRSLGEVNFIRFGELDDRSSARTERLRDAFARAGIKAEIPADIQKALWEKFLFVVSVGGVAAVRREPIGTIREDEEGRRMLELSMREIYRLARARQVNLDASIVATTMSFVDQLPADGTTSLQRDLEEGKASELDAWNGAVVRLAHDSGIDAPVHTFIYESLLSRTQESAPVSN